MVHRRLVAAAAAFGLVAFASSTPATAMGAKAFMKAVNGDADKTISKAELDAYAKQRFAALEADNDKTLDQKELKGRLSAAGMAMADTDKDKTVDEAEFTGYADKLFDEANKKGDVTLSVEELASPAGKKLIQLLE